MLITLKEKMILTDRAKELFEDYFIEKYNNNQDSYLNLGYGMSIVEGFYSIPLSMQFGAYADWFDTQDIKIEVRSTPNGNFTYTINEKTYPHIGFTSRTEARKEALVSANLLYNEMEKVFK